jgi:hypothetical protein
MRRIDTASESQTGAGNRRRRLTASLLAAAMIPALLQAQSLSEPTASLAGPVTVLTSPLYSVYPGHVLAVRIDDVGPLGSQTLVTLEFRDAADQRRAFKTAVLPGHQSVELLMRIPAGGRQTMRARVSLTATPGGGRGRPFVVLEDLNPDAFTIETKPPCPVSQQPEFPGGAEGDCGGGWVVNRLTLEQASGVLD